MHLKSFEPVPTNPSIQVVDVRPEQLAEIEALWKKVVLKSIFRIAHHSGDPAVQEIYKTVARITRYPQDST